MSISEKSAKSSRHSQFLNFRSETPVSAMGEDSNQSAMSDSQDATKFNDFANKINPSSSGPTPTVKDPQGPKE